MLLSHSPNLQLASAARPSRSMNIAREAALALLGSLFVAVCAHIAVPLPFTPVPFTLQPFAVLLIGMLLGPGTGFAAMALYLSEGAAGLPVFTPLGLPGMARLIGPTGGYLFAYPLAAAIAGGLPLLLRARKLFATYAFAGAAAMALIYTCGAWWFSTLVHAHFFTVLRATVTPFALSDTVKLLAAAGIASAWQLRGTRA